MIRPYSVYVVIGICVYLISCQPNTSVDICTNYPDWSESKFVLPYPVGKEYTVIQGNCSDPNAMINSHVGFDRYSYDFAMEIGSVITASLGGEVVFVREEFTDQDKGLDQGNVVVIKHADGTHAAYGHLAKDGVLPELGEFVEQGDIIAFSGNSGRSSIPHLHFHLSPCLDQSICETLPVTFRNTSSNPNGLQVSQTYMALDINS